jgi:thioredoxin 1
MSEHLVELDEASFAQKTGTGVALVDFWAPWCGPCRAQTPILESLSKKTEGKYLIAKINVDEQPGLATRFNVRSIPTLLILKDGAVVKQFVGVQQEQKLLAELEQA